MLSDRLLVIVPSTKEEAIVASPINRARELLAQDQAIYYVGGHSGHVLTHSQGREDAPTWADYINVGMEHGAFDIAGLAEYMKGLVAGGPTRSGHRTPTVIVNVPVNGTDEAAVRANAWMFQQVLATGVHGIMLTHADTPGAVRAFVEAVRFPIHREGVGQNGLKEGRRGLHGVPTAAETWGLSQLDYVQKADLWPLNPMANFCLASKRKTSTRLRMSRR